MFDPNTDLTEEQKAEFENGKGDDTPENAVEGDMKNE